MEFSYNDLRDRIILKLKEATGKLREMEYESQHIAPREFFDYMTGETPTGDIITILDVLKNDFLMIHEAVEISELKKNGIPINNQTVIIYYPEVYKAHLSAMDYELTHALNKRNYIWLKRRLRVFTLEDQYLPQEFKDLQEELAPQYRSMMKKFSDQLPKK